jgi:hypothetical protein
MLLYNLLRYNLLYNLLCLFRLFSVFSCFFLLATLITYESFAQEKISFEEVQIIDSVYAPNTGMMMKIVQRNKNVGMVNDTGKVVIPLIYEQIAPFRGKDSECTRWEGILKVRKGGQCALIMPDGKPICTFSYDEIYYLPETCESNAPESMLVKFKQFGKMGLGDARGNMLIRTSYEDIWLLKDTAGRLVMPEVAVVRKEGKLGMMEIRQKLILKADYEGIEFLQLLKEADKPKAKTFLLLKTKIKGKWGIINLTTQKTYSHDFDRIEPFTDGLALIQKDRKFGYIDIDEDLKISNKYDFATSFQNKVAIVAKNNRFGLINTSDKAIIPLDYDEVKLLFPTETEDKFLASLYIVRKAKLYAILNATGQIVVPLLYESLKFKKGDYTGTGIKDGKEEEVDMIIPKTK